LFDCFGNKYEVIKMLPTGFCGFHALSYSFTGSQFSYADIIDDSINVFGNIPQLFRLRTNFASGENSSHTLNDYADFMRNAIQRVQSGFAIDNLAWAEDGHFAALSLLYDVEICICVYHLENQQWHVFNEQGKQGYICFLNSPGPFDVLNGVCGPPIIPVSAHTHAIGRQNLDTSNDAVKTDIGNVCNVDTVLNLSMLFRSILQVYIYLIIQWLSTMLRSQKVL